MICDQCYPSDRIGLLLDMEEGSLSVYRNDLRLGTVLQSDSLRRERVAHEGPAQLRCGLIQK